MPPTMDPSRDLLFGLLALQNGLIDQGQLVAAFQAWTRDKARPMADHLVSRGDLDGDDRVAVEALVTRHLKRHGGDPEQCLSAINAGRSTRESLARVGDADIETFLAHLGPTSPQVGEDTDRTASYAVGTATSDGQRFRVLRPHARGGLGAVFVALDTEVHREVALKQILDRHADDPTSRQRFLLEAEITGGLEHPGIVPVYGLGTYGDGRPYYSMRFIRGDSLKEAIDRFHSDELLKKNSGRRSLELRKLLRRFTDVCNAIDYAHSRGVLHRDIKPGNIIVGRYGETLVVDWGLAKATGQSDPGSGERPLMPSSAIGSAETLAGSVLGTPAYMSPEQAEGQLDRLGPRSDVYSLGATLHCLLTGSPPFEGDIADVIRAVQRGDFRSSRALEPVLDRALDAVCLKAMALNPADRYCSCRALAEDIERWMADEPVTAWSEPLPRRARRWARRNRAAVMAAAVAVMVALAGMALVLAIQTRANAELQLSNDALGHANAVVRRTNTELFAANARKRQQFNLAMDAVKLFHGEVSEDLLFKEKQFAGLRTKLLRGAANFYTKLEGLLKGQTDMQSRAALGRSYGELGELTNQISSKPEALAVHRKALAVRRELAGAPAADAATRADVASSLLAVAQLQQAIGDTGGSLASHEEARALAEGLAATTSGANPLRALLALSHYRLSELLWQTGKLAESRAAIEQAIAIYQNLVEADPSVSQFAASLARSHQSMGLLFRQEDKPAEALRSSERALAIFQRLAEADPSATQFQDDVGTIHEIIGYLLFQSGKPAEALVAFERMGTTFQKLAADNPNVTEFQAKLASSHVNVGWALRQTGKMVEALAAIEKAITIQRKVADDNPRVTDFQSRLAVSLAIAGELQQKAGKPVQAVAFLQQAVAIYERLPTRTPRDLYNLACTHAALAGIAAEPGSEMTADERRAEAEQAMQWLRRAVAAGYRNVGFMRSDNSLNPLRSRPDFQVLMMDLAMPVEPFASGEAKPPD
jgi:eukaryotic-like serine/threonine-protein kinase